MLHKQSYYNFYVKEHWRFRSFQFRVERQIIGCFTGMEMRVIISLRSLKFQINFLILFRKICRPKLFLSSENCSSQTTSLESSSIQMLWKYKTVKLLNYNTDSLKIISSSRCILRKTLDLRQSIKTHLNYSAWPACYSLICIEKAFDLLEDVVFSQSTTWNKKKA